MPTTSLEKYIPRSYYESIFQSISSPSLKKATIISAIGIAILSSTYFVTSNNLPLACVVFTVILCGNRFSAAIEEYALKSKSYALFYGAIMTSLVACSASVCGLGAGMIYFILKGVFISQNINPYSLLAILLTTHCTFNLSFLFLNLDTTNKLTPLLNRIIDLFCNPSPIKKLYEESLEEIDDYLDSREQISFFSFNKSEIIMKVLSHGFEQFFESLCNISDKEYIQELIDHIKILNGELLNTSQDSSGATSEAMKDLKYIQENLFKVLSRTSHKQSTELFNLIWEHYTILTEKMISYEDLHSKLQETSLKNFYQQKVLDKCAQIHEKHLALKNELITTQDTPSERIPEIQSDLIQLHTLNRYASQVSELNKYIIDPSSFTELNDLLKQLITHVEKTKNIAYHEELKKLEGTPLGCPYEYYENHKEFPSDTTGYLTTAYDFLATILKVDNFNSLKEQLQLETFDEDLFRLALANVGLKYKKDLYILNIIQTNQKIDIEKACNNLEAFLSKATTVSIISPNTANTLRTIALKIAKIAHEVIERVIRFVPPIFYCPIATTIGIIIGIATAFFTITKNSTNYFIEQQTSINRHISFFSLSPIQRNRYKLLVNGEWFALNHSLMLDCIISCTLSLPVNILKGGLIGREIVCFGLKPFSPTNLQRIMRFL